LSKFANISGVVINITVFERSDYVGGRSTTANVYNNSANPVELGASIFVEVNRILQNATAEFNLTAKDRISDADEPEILGIWNGEKFVYTQKEGGWAWWDITKLIWNGANPNAKADEDNCFQVSKALRGAFLPI
jgi:prenylcysteine oxidase/farnesylcysteine lyase